MFELDKIDENLEQLLLQFDNEDIPFYLIYMEYCVFAGTILFTVNYIILLTGLVKKQKILLQIWLLFEGAINSVSMKITILTLISVYLSSLFVTSDFRVSLCYKLQITKWHIFFEHLALDRRVNGLF